MIKLWANALWKIWAVFSVFWVVIAAAIFAPSPNAFRSRIAVVRLDAGAGNSTLVRIAFSRALSEDQVKAEVEGPVGASLLKDPSNYAVQPVTLPYEIYVRDYALPELKRALMIAFIPVVGSLVLGLMIALVQTEKTSNLLGVPPAMGSAGLDSDSNSLFGSTYFGPTLLFSLVLLSVLIVGGSSPRYGLGYTVGRIATSLALALPCYIVTRYFTLYGRRLNRNGKLNVLCLFTVAVWCFQIVALTFLPYLMANKSGSKNKSPKVGDENVGVSQPVPRLPKGAVDWSQFTPIDKDPASR